MQIVSMREDMKEFFEVLVTFFEKQSSAAGGYRGKMTRVLEIFRKAILPATMLDLHVEGLVGRLFKQFLTSANSNTSDTLLEIEQIMTTIIVESGELALDLKALIITTLDKIDSPVCWLLGERVLLNCAAKLQPRLLDMICGLWVDRFDFESQRCSTHCFWGSGNFSGSSLSKVNIAGDQVLLSLLGSLVLYYPLNQYKCLLKTKY
nr:phospholipase-like protein [Tanacetum cinerariifolium]